MHTHINVKRFYCHCCAIETLNSNSPSIFCQAIMSLAIIGQMYLLFTTNQHKNNLQQVDCMLLHRTCCIKMIQNIIFSGILGNTYLLSKSFLQNIFIERTSNIFHQKKTLKKNCYCKTYLFYSFATHLTFYEITSCFLKKNLEFERCSLNLMLFTIRHMSS